MGKSKHQHEGQDLHLNLYREQLGVIPLGHDTSRPTVQFPREMFISDLDPIKIHFLKTIPNFMKSLDAMINWDHNTETELHVLCTLGKNKWEAEQTWKENVEESIHTLLSEVQVQKRGCLKNCWKEVCKEVKKLRRSNQTVAIIERADDLAVYVVGRAEAVQAVYDYVDETCKEVEQTMEQITDTVELKDLERDALQRVNLKLKLEKKYPHARISFKEKNMELSGPAVDLRNIRNDVNAFLRNLEKRSVPLSGGKMKVFTMLQRQTTHSFNSSIERLEILIHKEGNSINLLGASEDLDKFEEILRNTIKEIALEVPEEEQTAFREDIWEEFYNHLFIKYTGLLHIELVDRKSAVNITAYYNDFSGLSEDVQKHIQTKAVREVPVELEQAKTRKVLQWMKLEQRHPRVKIIQDGNVIKLQVPSVDYPVLYQELNAMVRNTETRNLKIPTGQMEVFSMLRKQGNNQFINALDNLRVGVISLKANCMILFGMMEDLDKFEETIEDNIKETLVEVSSEEQLALEKTIWREFKNTMLLKYSGILYLAMLENKSSVRVVTHSDSLNTLLRDVKEYLKRNAVREVILGLGLAEAKMVLQWMRLELNHPTLKITLNAKSVLLKGPPNDSLAAGAQLQTFLATLGTKNLALSLGQMKVFTTLVGQVNSPLHATLERLEVVWHLEANSIILFGVMKDVAVFEEILAKSINGTTLNLSDEERAPFVETDWSEYYNALLLKYRGTFHVELTEDYASLVLVAQTENLNDILKDLTQYIQQNSMKKLHLDLEPDQVGMVLQWIQLDTKYPVVKIAQTENVIRLKGTPSELAGIEKEIDSFLHTISKINVDLSRGQMKIFTLLRQQVTNPFNNLLKELKVTFHQESDTILLFGVTKDIDEFQEILSDNIKESTIEVSAEEEAALDETIWKEFTREMSARYLGLLYLETNEDKASIDLATEVENFDKILERVTEHIENNSVKEMRIDLEEDQLSVVLKWIKLESRYPKVKITQEENVIILKGSPNDSAEIEKELDSFLQNVDKRNIDLSRGQVKIFSKLRQEIRNPFTNSLEKLHVIYNVENSSLFLFGVAEDLDTLEELLTNKIKETTIEVTPEEEAALDETIWKEFSRGVHRRYASLLHLEPTEDKSSVNFVAQAEDFYDILEEVKEHIQNNAAKEISVDLEVDQTRALIRWIQLEDQYPRMKASVTNLGIQLMGPLNDLLNIERELESLIRNTDERRLNQSKGAMYVFQLLQTQPQSQFNKTVDTLKVTTTIADDNIIVFGVIEDLDKFEENLTNNIKEETIEISTEEQAAFRENVWEEFCGILLVRYTGILHLELTENNTSLNLATITKAFYGVLDEIKRYINRNAMREMTVEMDEYRTRFIVQWMQEDLMDITEDLTRYQVDIKQRDDGGFVITGSEDGLGFTRRKLDRVRRKIISGTHIVTTPGMPYYFTLEIGKSFIRSIEDKLHVVIHPKDMEMPRRQELPRASSPVDGDLTLNEVHDVINGEEDESYQMETSVEKGKMLPLISEIKYYASQSIAF